MIADEVTEASIEALDAELAAARANKLAAAKSLTEARAVVAAAKEKRGALVQSALTGVQPEFAELAGAEAALDDAGCKLRFKRDVDEAADAAVESAQTARTRALFLLKQHNAIREAEAVNAKLYALVPHQPTDAELLAAPAGLLGRMNKEAEDAYQAAYHHHQGPQAHPTFAPRQRIIQEGQDVGAWKFWAAAVGDAPGWQTRAFIRQVRIAIAARDHFAKYTKFGLDDLRRLNSVDYNALRARLPTADGGIAPLAFAPLKVA